MCLLLRYLFTECDDPPDAPAGATAQHPNVILEGDIATYECDNPVQTLNPNVATCTNGAYVPADDPFVGTCTRTRKCMFCSIYVTSVKIERKIQRDKYASS